MRTRAGKHGGWNKNLRGTAVFITGLLKQLERGEHHFVRRPFVFHLEIRYRYVGQVFGQPVTAVMVMVGRRRRRRSRQRHDRFRASGLLTGHLDRDILQRNLFAVHVLHVVLRKTRNESTTLERLDG